MRGGDISLLTQLCERTRADAYASMVTHALALGANAVIAVRAEGCDQIGTLAIDAELVAG